MTVNLRRSLLALTAGLASACALAGPAEAFEPRVPESFFGISAPALWSLTEQNLDAARDAQLDGMKAAGIDWARIELGWREIEPSAPTGGVHAYDWRAADRLVGALAARGMELLAVPMGTPAWAASTAATAAGCGRASEVAGGRTSDYATFAAAIVARYGAGGTFWTAHPELSPVPVTRIEIGNEPNWNGFWCPEPNPERFGAMLAETADRIHAVNPAAQVVLGGLAALQDSQHQGELMRGMAADEFLERAVAHEPGLTESIDAVGFHPYDIDPAMNLSIIGWLRHRLAAVGLQDAEILLTEFGWHGGSSAGSLAELLRASNYTQMTNQMARTDCGVSAVAAHTWQSDELDLLDPDDWYGIVSPLTGLLHPSGIAYSDQVALFEGRGPTPAPRQTVDVCGAAEPPDQDGDGVPDSEDDYPLDPDRGSGSGEQPPPPPEADPEEPRPHVQRVPDSYFGVNVIQLPDDFTRLGAEFEAISSARIGTVRQRIDWSHIEPVPPTDPDYARRARWSWLDRVVLNMAAAGLALRPAFGKRPDWVADAAFDAEYAAFMTRFAERYGAGGDFWAENGNLDEQRHAIREYEIWQYGNLDPDSPTGAASAGGYAATYLGTRSALRAVDPEAGAVLSLGELGPAGYAGKFVRDMVAARPELNGSIDGVMVMAQHSRAAWQIDLVLADLRNALDDTGNATTPIFLGFGAPTAGPDAVSEADRAQLYTSVASRSARGDCGVAGVFAHAWTTPEADPGNSWHWFGIADKDDASLSQTAEAYRDVAAEHRGYGVEPAPANAFHPCAREAPDSDGDGTPDPADPAPLDPQSSEPTALPPSAPTIEGGPASPTALRSATFSLSAPGATEFQCRLDSGPFQTCGSSPSFSGLAHGEHMLRVRAVDDLGLVGPAAEHRWTVDAVAPRVVDISGPGPVSNSTKVTFSFRSDDEAAALACRLDGHDWEWCTSPKTYPFVGEGRHEFRVAAIDPAWNIGPIEFVEFRIEILPPPSTPVISSPAEGATTGPHPTFTFSAERATSYDCRIDQGDWGPCSGNGTHTPAHPLDPTPHVFQVRGVDNQGRIGPMAYRWIVVADPTLPGTPMITSPAEGATTGTRPTFRFSAPRAASYQCRIDSDAWGRCSGNGTHTPARPLARSSHVFRVRGIDRSGRIGPEAYRRIVVQGFMP